MWTKISVCLLTATAAVAKTIIEPTLARPWNENVDQTVEGKDLMEISIALPSTNIDVLAKLVEEVSTPGSPSYGKYLSSSEVRASTKPDPEYFKTVMDWLRSHGVSSKAYGSNVIFRAAPSKIEEIFKTRVRSVRNAETGMKKLRAGTYTLPSHLEEKVTAVYGLHGMPLPIRKLEAKAGKTPVEVNPDVIIKRYQVGGVQVTRGLINRQAVAEFQGQNAEQSDLNIFFKEQVNRSAYKDGDEHIYKVVGVDGKRSGTEAALDIQYIMGVAPGIKTEFWGYPGFDFCKDMNDFTTQILETEDVPNVFSISYGWQGNLSVLGCNDDDIAITNDNFLKIAARGISVLISSGDSGSQYTDGKLYPSWPASSPYVTAVGGTRFVDQNVDEAEMAVDQFGSGGGFSYDFDRKKAQWQEHDVIGYLANVTHKPPRTAYRADGRGTPDVSGIAEGYIVYTNGMRTHVGGTSASAPMFAAIVSLLNEARSAAGKSAMGLLNPFLYQNPEAFTDIYQGTGRISRTGAQMPEGWDCARGWDAATGLGTPIFHRLLQAALNA